MADNTAIEWTDATWNPIIGCSKVSAGCDHCYAERMARRQHGKGTVGYKDLTDEHGWTGKVRLIEDRLAQPTLWHKPRRIFVCSMSDLFHERVTIEMRERVYQVIEACPQHTFQILTKRPERVMAYWLKPTNNVWLGVTTENQQAADARIPLLLQCPAAVRFVSLEPMLGAVDLRSWLWRGRQPGLVVGPMSAIPMHGTKGASGVWGLDWVIVGGETGPGARPVQPDWARDVRDQCKAAGVPFFFKKISSKEPTPDDLTIREYPKGTDDVE